MLAPPLHFNRTVAYCPIVQVMLHYVNNENKVDRADLSDNEYSNAMFDPISNYSRDPETRSLVVKYLVLNDSVVTAFVVIEQTGGNAKMLRGNVTSDNSYTSWNFYEGDKQDWAWENLTPSLHNFEELNGIALMSGSHDIPNLVKPYDYKAPFTGALIPSDDEIDTRIQIAFFDPRGAVEEDRGLSYAVLDAEELGSSKSNP